MVTQHAGSAADTRLNQGPEGPSAVVFRGDGEPRAPETMVQRLADIVRGRGIDYDGFTLGGVVEDLETRFAALLGKQAAVFMPTGTLANHLAIRNLCGGKSRAIVQEQSHLHHDTGDCVQRLSGIHLVPIAPGRTWFTFDEVRATVEASGDGRVATPVGALMIESPVRRRHGQIMPVDEMSRITSYCNDLGIGTHLDGARLFMMSAATGISPAEYSAMFNTVYVSLYKYLGAPFGAMLAGAEDFCRDLYHDRRMFGGGLASSGLAAALALHGLEDFEARFDRAMTKAHALFEDLSRLLGLNVRPYEDGSNIFPLELAPGIDAGRLIEGLTRWGVFAYPDEGDPTSIHLTVNTTILRQSNADLVRAFEAVLNVG